MTEAEWLTCTELEDLVIFLAGTTRMKPGGASWDEPAVVRALRRRGIGRKLRLLACACARRVWAGLDPAAIAEEEKEACRRAVEVAERFADGRAGRRELAAAWARARPLLERYEVSADGCAPATGVYCAGTSLHEPCEGTHRAAQAAAFLRAPRGTRDDRWYRAYADEVAAQCDLLRCVVGNPFRPAAFDPGWRTSDVLGVARGVYDDRVFERLPILADALVDAGCADEQLLSHCRSPGPHARGCWAVDLILGKE